MPRKAFLFDLDMTLLDTSSIENLRASQNWTTAIASLHLVQPFATKTPVHEVPGKLKAAGLKVAVVTSSPRNYAEAILKKFGVKYDVLVAYHDTRFHKPDAAPLERALADLGVTADEAINIGDHPYDLEAAIRAGVFSVCAGWGLKDQAACASYAPDVLLMDPEPLLSPGTLASRRFYAERLIKSVPYVGHDGSVLPCGGTPPRYAVGRYFTRGDPRCANHALSTAILDFKTASTHAVALAKAIALATKQLSGVFRADWMTSVPPKPSQNYNRFLALWPHLAALLGGTPQIEPKGLRCTKEVSNYKQLNPAERAQAAKGIFASDWNWKGNKIWLIDDVVTTGATVEECARVLLAAGASEVRILGFAADQLKIATHDCPLCARPMKLRKNKSTGEDFWGCTGYPNDCKNTESV